MHLHRFKPVEVCVCNVTLMNNVTTEHIWFIIYSNISEISFLSSSKSKVSWSILPVGRFVGPIYLSKSMRTFLVWCASECIRKIT